MPGLPADSQAILDKLLARTGFADAIRQFGIAPEYAVGLYRIVLARQPKRMVEIGMANGASTLAILSALADLGGERLLISIDPGQSTQWRNVGLNNVQANGLAGWHRLIEAPDYLALPDLLQQHTQLDAAYVDGWHTFDYVLLDIFYLDKLLPVGSTTAAGA